MSKPPRVRRFPGPRVWALAQEAYLAGESARSIAERLDLTVNGLRKRAARHGWTRTQYARALSRAEHPARALSALLARIGRRVDEGRLEEATELVRAAERLARAVRAAPPMPRPELSEAQMKAWRAAETRRLEAQWGARARAMAEALLSDRGYELADRWAPAALRWRARVLGPEQAAADFARGVAGGWADLYWDETGRLWPPRQPPPPPPEMMAQHRRQCAWRRANGKMGEEEV